MIIGNDLTAERDNLVSELANYCSKEKSITAYFLGGSLAKNNADEFSDIDYRVVIDKSIPKSQTIEALLNHFQKQIAFIETQNSFYAVIHFLNFVKVDLFVYYPSDIVPSVWLKDILILQDSDRLLEKVKSASTKVNDTISQSEVEQYLKKYTAYVHELYRRYFRKEYNYCEHCTLMMKHIIISLWKAEQGLVPNDLGDWSKYEGTRSTLTTDQKEYIRMHTPFDLNNIEGNIESMNKELLISAKKVADDKQFQINFDRYDRLINLVFRRD